MRSLRSDGMTADNERAPKQQTAKALLGLRDLILTGEIEPGEQIGRASCRERV